jgi:16S rRNA C1402 N4-methylase RsmH
LVEALEAAERILSPNGILAVITFHSLEDQDCKKIYQTQI